MVEKDRTSFNVSKQLENELIKLARKSEEEIIQLTIDYTNALESKIRVPTKLLDWYGHYDNLLISFVQILLVNRLKMREQLTEKRLKELEENRK